MSEEIRIYVADLAAYNNGFLIGEWVSLPQEQEIIDKQIEAILKKGAKACKSSFHEEYFITDFEWEDISLCSIEEYENISKLNEQLQLLEDIEEYKLKVIKFLLDENFADDIKDAIEKTDDVIVYEEHDMEEIAYNYIRNNAQATNHYAIIQSGAENPSIHDNVFDPIEGHSFLLKVNEAQNGFLTYENSKVDEKVTGIYKTEAEFDKDIKENYDEFEYYVDAEKSLIKLTNIEKGICDVITNKIKQIDLENKYFRIVSNNTPLDVTLYNKDKEEITYHRIAKLKFSIKKDDVGVWNLEML